MSAANQVSVSQAALLLRDSFQVTCAPGRTRRTLRARRILSAPHRPGAREQRLPQVSPRVAGRNAFRWRTPLRAVHRLLHVATATRTRSSTCSPIASAAQHTRTRTARPVQLG